MGKETLLGAGKKGYVNYIVGFIIGIIITALFITLFALIMYFSGAAFKYAPVFATVAVGLGCFAAAFFTAKKQEKHGLFVGAVIGGITFVLITLISLIINSGGITVNTLFRFVIIMLSAIIGGIIGVNKGKNHKYI